MSRSMMYLGCERLSKCRALVIVFQLTVVLSFFNVKFPAVNASPLSAELSSANNEDNGMASFPALAEEKRNWQSLQGSWGKRAQHTGLWNPETVEADEEQGDHLVPLLISNGERPDPFLRYTMMYLTNVATLDRMMNQRQMEDGADSSRMSDDLLTPYEDNDVTDDGGIMTEKRTWKNMNAAWGKRRNAPTWNKFRGAWGKREPGWNNLKGMWGKRSSKDWQKLHAGWGKRLALN